MINQSIYIFFFINRILNRILNDLIVAFKVACCPIVYTENDYVIGLILYQSSVVHSWAYCQMKMPPFCRRDGDANLVGVV